MWVSTLPRSSHTMAYAPRYRRQSQLGALGMSKQASGAAQGASMGAKAGQLVIPIPGVGMVIGATVGAIAGFLLSKKNYINVGSDNQEEDEDVISIWPQYSTIAGSVAGRDIGLPLLERIFKGAVYSRSDFTKNNAKVCFHKGCLKYPGDPAWIHQTIFGSSKDRNTFPDIMPAAAGAGVTDPRAVVDQYYTPANASRGNGWAVPSTSLGRQVLIDIADAYLAQRGAPYTYGAPVAAAPPPSALPVMVQQPVQAVAAPAAAVAAVQNSMPITTSASGGPVVMPSSSAGSPVAATVVPVPVTAQGQVDTAGLVQSLLAQGQSQQQAYTSAMASMQAAGVQPTPQVQAATAQAVQAAGAGGMFSGMSGIAIVGALALASFALARPVGRSPRRRH